jgi:hypothetical protein
MIGREQTNRNLHRRQRLFNFVPMHLWSPDFNVLGLDG